MQDHIVASFAPCEKFCRFSEGSFLRLKDGRIIFMHSRFTEAQDDDAPSDIAATYSADEGETWSEIRLVFPASQFHVSNIMSVSLMRMHNDDLGAFFVVKHSPTENRIFLARSKDDGETFYKFIECTQQDRPGYYVLNNDRVICLSTGRLLVPATFHRGGYSNHDMVPYFWDSRSFACFLYSDDDGETWAESPDVVFAPFTRSNSGLQETGVVEKKNGVVWAYNRTDKMYQYEYFSMDGGLHWSAPQASRFTSPNSPMLIKRHPESGVLYAIWNPIPNYNGRKTNSVCCGRTPIVYASSQDDGATWSEYTALEGDGDRGYCYPAAFFTNDNAMLVAYSAGGPRDGNWISRLNMKKVAL